MNLQDAIRKVASLLRLAESKDEEEAASAMSKAQELIDRYKLSKNQLDNDQKEEDDEKVGDYGDQPLQNHANKLTLWEGQLAVALARMNQCEVYTSGDNIRTVGRPSDVDVCRYLFRYICMEIERITKIRCKGYSGKTWRDNFKLGMVDTIREKLRTSHEQLIQKMKEEARATPNNSMALTVINNNLITLQKKADEARLYVKTNLRLGKSRLKGPTETHSARSMGREYGHEVNVFGHKGLGGGSQGRLNG